MLRDLVRAQSRQFAAHELRGQRLPGARDLLPQISEEARSHEHVEWRPGKLGTLAGDPRDHLPREAARELLGFAMLVGEVLRGVGARPHAEARRAAVLVKVLPRI